MTSGSSARLKRRPWWRGAPAIAISVLAIGGVGAGLYLTNRTTDDPYTTQTASISTIRQSISMSGTLEAVNQAGVNFAVAGKITAVPVQAGQTVTAGQTLATVDPAALVLTLSKAQATLASAQAKLAADQAAYDAGGDSAPSDAQISSDTASVQSAFTDALNAQNDVTNATLTAPIAGTVVAVNAAVGDTVSAGSSTSGSTASTAATATNASTSSTGSGSGAGGGGGGQNSANQSSAQSSSAGSSSGSSTGSSTSSDQFVIQDLTSFQVAGTVTSADVSSVTPGMTAIVTPSSSATTVQGSVTSVNSIPTVTNGTAAFPVVVSITGSTDGLYSGVSATVALVTSETPNVLTVPTAAVQTANNVSTVSKVVNGEKVATKVVVGTSGGGLTQITSGLKEGDTVAITTVTTAAGGTGATGFGARTGFGGAGGTGFGGQVPDGARFRTGTGGTGGPG